MNLQLGTEPVGLEHRGSGSGYSPVSIRLLSCSGLGAEKRKVLPIPGDLRATRRAQLEDGGPG